jgi:hypothetical protein
MRVFLRKVNGWSNLLCEACRNRLGSLDLRLNASHGPSWNLIAVFGNWVASWRGLSHADVATPARFVISPELATPPRSGRARRDTGDPSAPFVEP